MYAICASRWLTSPALFAAVMAMQRLGVPFCFRRQSKSGRYSPAMKRSGIAWTAETLDKYVADPQAFIPANRMPYAGMADAGDRADLLAYLLKATR